jgi:Domain of unknown function (DUF3850)
MIADIQAQHELKTWKESFYYIVKGRKLAEVRKNDRDYQVDQRLILCEVDEDNNYLATGNKMSFRINHITYLNDWIPFIKTKEELLEEYVVLSLYFVGSHLPHPLLFKPKTKV